MKIYFKFCVGFKQMIEKVPLLVHLSQDSPRSSDLIRANEDSLSFLYSS